ncbi:hypothetical protein BOX15_Mlig006438g1 [Macrostomum lignano]|uniref:poly(ADP-ribose) glycohydrolase n=1 Tax=Macrostomum lignano TaxID=282301 RepID=A0A267GDL3_9PLAT|nr:hypothetical protein BOX15_Mlig006438g1 [Macrostomum lignano]
MDNANSFLTTGAVTEGALIDSQDSFVKCPLNTNFSSSDMEKSTLEADHQRVDDLKNRQDSECSQNLPVEIHHGSQSAQAIGVHQSNTYSESSEMHNQDRASAEDQPAIDTNLKGQESTANAPTEKLQESNEAFTQQTAFSNSIENSSSNGDCEVDQASAPLEDDQRDAAQQLRVNKCTDAQPASSASTQVADEGVSPHPVSDGLCTVEQLASAIGDTTGEQAGVLASNNETKLMTDDEDDDNDLGSNKNKSFMSFHDEKVGEPETAKPGPDSAECAESSSNEKVGEPETAKPGPDSAECAGSSSNEKVGEPETAKPGPDSTECAGSSSNEKVGEHETAKPGLDSAECAESSSNEKVGEPETAKPGPDSTECAGSSSNEKVGEPETAKPGLDSAECAESSSNEKVGEPETAKPGPDSTECAGSSSNEKVGEHETAKPGPDSAECAESSSNEKVGEPETAKPGPDSAECAGSSSNEKVGEPETAKPGPDSTECAGSSSNEKVGEHETAKPGLDSAECAESSSNEKVGEPETAKPGPDSTECAGSSSNEKVGEHETAKPGPDSAECAESSSNEKVGEPETAKPGPDSAECAGSSSNEKVGEPETAKPGPDSAECAGSSSNEKVGEPETAKPGPDSAECAESSSNEKVGELETAKPGLGSAECAESSSNEKAEAPQSKMAPGDKEKQADENANEDLDLGVGADLESLKKVSTAPEHMLERASHNHTVMFDISKLSNVNFTERPLPPYSKSWQRRMDADDYVRLAYHTNRWSEIRKNLLSLCSANVTYYHLEEVIMLCGSLDRDINQFDVLRHFFTQEMEPAEADHLLKNLLPRIVNLAVSLPDLIKAPIPLLKHRKVMKLSLSQQQIASLLANAFFCTFPQQGGPYSRFPSINFHSLYSSGGHQSPCGRRLEKLRCIFNYFNRITKKEPYGVVTISRRRLKQNLDWCSRVEPIPKLLHVSSIGTIEDTDGEFLEADFANKYIGGGVLGHGFVQEEIRFSICPELIVTRLVAECMDDREALHVKGFERFSNYTGYANSCQWDGNHQDARSIGLDRRRRSHLVAMDALKFSNWREQFCRNNINRELHKALVAFGDVPRNQRSAIATGNWGCGAFKGDVRLKFLIQLMACAVAGRSMAYFTFGDKTLQQRLLKMHRFLTDKEVCVGGVYSAVIAFTEHLDSSCHGGWQYNSDSAPDLFEFLRNYVLHGPTVPPPTEPSISKKDIRKASKRANANKKKQERQQNSSDVQESKPEKSQPEESKPNNELSDQSGQVQVANAESEKQATAADLSDANSGAQAQETRSSDGEWKQQKRKNKPNKSGLKSSQKSKSATEEQLSSKMSNMNLSSTTPQTNRGENRRKRCSESSRSAGAGPGATPRGCAEQLPEPSKKKLRKDKRKKQNKNKK